MWSISSGFCVLWSPLSHGTRSVVTDGNPYIKRRIPDATRVWSILSEVTHLPSVMVLNVRGLVHMWSIWAVLRLASTNGQTAKHADLGREVRTKLRCHKNVTKCHTLLELPKITSGGGSGDASTV